MNDSGLKPLNDLRDIVIIEEEVADGENRKYVCSAAKERKPLNETMVTVGGMMFELMDNAPT
jgi:hypothetical protein